MAAAPAVAATSTINDAQIVSGNAFVRNSWVQSGLKDNGSLGTPRGTSMPTGFSSVTGDHDPGELGFIAEGNEDGTFENGDFFTPGSPYEGWGLRVGEAGSAKTNSNVITGIPGSWVSSETVGDASATWTATSDTDGIGVTQVVSAPANGAHLIHVKVTLANNSSATHTVYYMRQVDADNGVDPVCRATPTDCGSADDAYNTYNAIMANSTSSQLVTSTSYVDFSTIGLRASDPDAVVRISDWENPINGTGIDAVIAGYRSDFKVGYQDYVDSTIDLAVRKVIAAGASATIDFDYILSPALGGVPNHAIDLNLDVSVGDDCALASNYLSGGGLKPNSDYILTEHSTPRILLSGKTDANGNFFNDNTLPATCRPGDHTLVLSGTDPAGAYVSDLVPYPLKTSCKFNSLDKYAKANGVADPEDPAAQLAATGVDPVPTSVTLVLGALAVLAGLSMLIVMRRKRA